MILSYLLESYLHILDFIISNFFSIIMKCLQVCNVYVFMWRNFVIDVIKFMDKIIVDHTVVVVILITLFFLSALPTGDRGNMLTVRHSVAATDAGGGDGSGAGIIANGF